MASYAAELGRCPLFGRLSAPELGRIADASRRVKYRAGEQVFREGEACEGFYVVTAGAVRLYKIGPDGRERTLHIVRPPHSFAEAAMFGPVTYPAFAQTVADSTLILVRREPFLQMMRGQPDVALRLFESLSTWLHRLLLQLESETFLNARAKLANYLLKEACPRSLHAGPCQIDLRHAKKDVATQLGMAPETLSRAQTDLEARGLIRVSGHHIDVPDGAALERLLLGSDTGY